jgi:hypothetical protein
VRRGHSLCSNQRSRSRLNTLWLWYATVLVRGVWPDAETALIFAPYLSRRMASSHCRFETRGSVPYCRTVDSTRIYISFEVEESLQDQWIGGIPSSNVQWIADFITMGGSTIGVCISFEKQVNLSDIASIYSVA